MARFRGAPQLGAISWQIAVPKCGTRRAGEGPAGAPRGYPGSPAPGVGMSCQSLPCPFLSLSLSVSLPVQFHVCPGRSAPLCLSVCLCDAVAVSHIRAGGPPGQSQSVSDWTAVCSLTDGSPKSGSPVVSPGRHSPNHRVRGVAPLALFLLCASV